MYLEFAELQARNRKVMTMSDWIDKLDDFLKISDMELLSHAGKISHTEAAVKARLEYDKFHSKQLEEPTQVENDFIEAEMGLGTIEKIAKNLKINKKSSFHGEHGGRKELNN